MSLRSVSHIEFKKCQCRPVDFRDQGPDHSIQNIVKIYVVLFDTPNFVMAILMFLVLLFTIQNCRYDKCIILIYIH